MVIRQIIQAFLGSMTAKLQLIWLLNSVTEIVNILSTPIENIEQPLNIHNILTTDNGSFISDVINHDNHQLFSANHSQLVLEQVNTPAPQTYIAINTSFEEQSHPSFG